MSGALETLVGNMTVAQLADTAGLAIDEVVALVLTRGAAVHRQEARLAAAAGGPKKKKGKTNLLAPASGVILTDPAARKHNTRSQAGRARLDAAILKFLGASAEPVRAVEIRRAVGGTAAQIRSRLNYLIETEASVGYDGRASGTRYWVM